LGRRGLVAFFEHRIEPLFVDFLGRTANGVVGDQDLVAETRLAKLWQPWLVIAAFDDSENDAQHDGGLQTEEREVAASAMRCLLFGCSVMTGTKGEMRDANRVSQLSQLVGLLVAEKSQQKNDTYECRCRSAKENQAHLCLEGFRVEGRLSSVPPGPITPFCRRSREQVLVIHLRLSTFSRSRWTLAWLATALDLLPSCSMTMSPDSSKAIVSICSAKIRAVQTELPEILSLHSRYED
jgi:hypothetical protein